MLTDESPSFWIPTEHSPFSWFTLNEPHRNVFIYCTWPFQWWKTNATEGRKWQSLLFYISYNIPKAVKKCLLWGNKNMAGHNFWSTLGFPHDMCRLPPHTHSPPWPWHIAVPLDKLMRWIWPFHSDQTNTNIQITSGTHLKELHLHLMGCVWPNLSSPA